VQTDPKGIHHRRQRHVGGRAFGASGHRRRRIERLACLQTVDHEANVFGATGQQLVVGDDAGVFVEVDLGSYRGGDIAAELLNTPPQLRSNLAHPARRRRLTAQPAHLTT